MRRTTRENLRTVDALNAAPNIEGSNWFYISGARLAAKFAKVKFNYRIYCNCPSPFDGRQFREVKKYVGSTIFPANKPETSLLVPKMHNSYLHVHSFLFFSAGCYL